MLSYSVYSCNCLSWGRKIKWSFDLLSQAEKGRAEQKNQCFLVASLKLKRLPMDKYFVLFLFLYLPIKI